MSSLPVGFNAPQFASQIEALDQLLRQFLAVLETEAEQLKHGDADALMVALQPKAQLGDALESAFTKITAQLPSQDNTAAALMELAKSNAFAAASPKLQQQVNRVVELIERCHALNAANGIAIRILSNINQTSLQILSGQSSDKVDLYSASGERTTAKSRSSLGKA